ncbi:oxidoreductase [Microvirga thermotolerans]|uniref:oxidoreductase n=1 Tax=Microvirga thermotolerans TaxID=2651334 RepID=UPI001AEEAB5D|nr:oxidoreductase [Microvirga thermotolerans]
MRSYALFVLFLLGLACAPQAGAGEALPAPRGAVILTVSGAIEATNGAGQARFDREMLEALGMASFRTTSAWSDGAQLYEGIPLRAVLDRVGARGSRIIASALNGYEIAIPSEDLKFPLLLATKVDGRVLTLRDKGPLWIVYPRDDYPELADVRYESRWVWQLNRLHIE